MNTEEKKEYDMYINWRITNNCNFTCEYCIRGNNQKAKCEPVDIPQIMARIKKFDKTILFNFTGGEPFLIPNFTELVMELSKNHLISIDTNLSQQGALNKFLKYVDPEKILMITFSTHVLEREKRKENLEELCLLANRFQQNGFIILGNYIAHPPLIERIERDINFFNERNVKVYVSLFYGRYKRKNYPVNRYGIISYTEREMEILKKFIPDSDWTDSKTRGNYCLAGSRAFIISDNKVLPCWTIPKNLGTFWGEWKTFDKVIRCPMPDCFCPFYSDLVANPPGLNLQTELLNKTIKECGAYSISESEKIAHVSAVSALVDKNIGLVGLFIKNHFPVTYRYLKNAKNIITQWK